MVAAFVDQRVREIENLRLVQPVIGTDAPLLLRFFTTTIHHYFPDQLFQAHRRFKQVLQSQHHHPSYTLHKNDYNFNI